MIPEWLQVLAVVALLGAFACALILVVDVVRRPQPMGVMNFVWPITALYLGPVAVWWYWALARPGSQPAPEHTRHGVSQRPFWKTIIVEATHCGAGCVLGDILAEFAIFFSAATIAGSVLFAEYVGDFVLAFTFGVAFQYFAIAPMRGLALLPGIKAAVQADAISLTAFEIGLFVWMFLMTRLPFHEALNPLQPSFWFLMQLGMIAGYATSYPANWFLVRAGIKQAM
jgi:hypothetical protein